MKKITITNTRALASAKANKKFEEENIRCSGCGRWVLIHSVYPSYNHPEAPPVCFDCLPDEIKKQLEEKINNEENAPKPGDDEKFHNAE